MLTYEMIKKLQPGTVVGHSSLDAADWEGTVVADRSRYWHDSAPGEDIRVRWHSGSEENGSLVRGIHWTAASYLTIKGTCPDCGRPAHYYFEGNCRDRLEGWYHDSRLDADTCWAGKARYEAGIAARG